METSIKRVRDHVPRPHQSHQQLENGPPHTKNLTSPGNGRLKKQLGWQRQL